MTKDDEALGRLRDHVRDDRTHDAALERIARGEGDAGDVPEEMAKASAPLGAAFEDAVVAKLAPTKAKPATVAKVTFLRRIGPYVGPLALAAAVLLYLTTRGAGSGEDGPVLPDYAASVRGDQTLRAAAAKTDGPLRVTSDASSFEIVVRPQTAPSSRVAAWVFTRAPDEEPTPLQAEVDVSPEGAVRIRGTGASLGRARELRIVVAPAGRTKFDDAAARARTAATDEHVRVLVVPIEREGR